MISAAIMAGFLPFADTEDLREEINSQLETMFRFVILTAATAGECQLSAFLQE